MTLADRRRSGPSIQKLLDVTSETLDLAIRAMARCRTWSEVATLMEQYVKSQGMYVVEKFVGHGIGQDMHEEPQVPNFVSKALRKNDIRLEPGLVLADRADGLPGDQGRRASTTAGPSRPRTGGSALTSSTRSR